MEEDIQADRVDQISVGPGEYFFIMDYQSESDLGPHRGRGVMYWDQVEEAYRFHWFDSFAPFPQLAVGSWEGDQLVFRHTAEIDGQSTTFVRTYALFTLDTVALTFEAQTPDEQTRRLISMTKRRAAED